MRTPETADHQGRLNRLRLKKLNPTIAWFIVIFPLKWTSWCYLGFKKRGTEQQPCFLLDNALCGGKGFQTWSNLHELLKNITLSENRVLPNSMVDRHYPYSSMAIWIYLGPNLTCSDKPIWLIVRSWP